MKELSIEEKAKAYDEVHEKIAIRFGSNVADEIFSQFEMSEDERVRKAIIEFFELQDDNTTYSFIPKNDIIAWLEKQGEQKPVVIAKFRVGDKIKLSCEPKYPAREIVEIKDNAYYFDSLVHLPIEKQNEWELVEQKPAWSEEDEKNLLEISCLIGNYRTGDDEYKLDSWLKDLKGRVQSQPKQEWSKEDKEMIEALNMYVKHLDVMFSEIKIGDKDILAKDFRKNVQNWLKSLKDRVQPKQEWSEEDKKMIIKFCQNLYDYPRIKSPFDNESFNEAQKEVQFIESLCYQSHWKPSDEQMEALYEETQKSDRIRDERIVSLYQDLKKLRKE